ncbi:unnamed protein product [Caretta caretta]
MESRQYSCCKERRQPQDATLLKLATWTWDALLGLPSRLGGSGGFTCFPSIAELLRNKPPHSCILKCQCFIFKTHQALNEGTYNAPAPAVPREIAPLNSPLSFQGSAEPELLGKSALFPVQKDFFFCIAPLASSQKRSKGASEISKVKWGGG